MSTATQTAPPPKPLQTIIEWKRIADEKPDEEITVLLAFYDGAIEPGYLDEGIWRQMDNMKYPAHYQPTLWADVPDVKELVGNDQMSGGTSAPSPSSPTL